MPARKCQHASDECQHVSDRDAKGRNHRPKTTTTSFWGVPGLVVPAARWRPPQRTCFMVRKWSHESIQRRTLRILKGGVVVIPLVFPKVPQSSLGIQQIPNEAPKTNLLLSIESWLLNRDPYNDLLSSLYNWVVEYRKQPGAPFSLLK